MYRQDVRVGVGVGAIHNPPRVKYSEETRNLIKILMEESKLTMMQRKSIQNAVDKGDPLPSSSRSSVSRSFEEKNVIVPCYWKKRTQQEIVNSGAYEREQYRRTTPILNKDKQKRHLACMMAFGKDMPETPHGPKQLHKSRKQSSIPDDIDPLNELVQGIRERMEFLNDMEKLGLGKKYRPIIQQEIAEKIRIIESFDNFQSAEINIKDLKYKRPSPKPYPMGELEMS
ncbi:hypothetical protein HCN44_002574 [Aphidius gifuensis]|uniref:Uncharacterized protein n=1 Tax=Aphidius gifuensis TaxID=684658 RepID=A0A834Y0F2_APHGI|nr:UPF0193 protein EVG1 [Aphidius gifuensis]KAF7996928.1 hypothetical protein HCN44_002574 [Aphidius gifuensis]